MARSDSAITGGRGIAERDGEQREELPAKPFTITFPGGNKPFTVSVCSQVKLDVSLCLMIPAKEMLQYGCVIPQQNVAD